jgi:hypothetical protein
MPVTHAGLVFATVLLTTTLLESLPGGGESGAEPARAVDVAAVPATDHPPARPARVTLLVNDPVRDPHAISDAIAASIDATEAGETIDVSTYLIDSPRIAAALRRAHRRGVAVRVILARTPTRRTPTSQALAEVLNAERDRSWLLWSVTAARGRYGMMHEKTFRFSRVGDAEWVTMTGSYNASDLADRASYATMWQVSGRRDVYERFAAIAAHQRSQKTMARPFRDFVGVGWTAYFLPSGRLRPDRDPVLVRLARIPAKPSSEVRIAMFSMWGERGTRIAQRLAALAHGGARVAFVAGPTVSPDVLDTLRAGGVRVRSGCFADGRYVHGKDMAATYVVGGQREFWTWIGSDNWTSRGMASDQAVLGFRGAGYRTFGRLFARLTARDDGGYGDACVPRQ